MGGSSGHRPVHPADVVAGLVHPGLPGLRTGSGDQPEVIALQNAVELALDGELQGPQRSRELRVADLTTPEGGRVDGLGVIGCLGGRRRLAHRMLAPATGDPAGPPGA